MRVGAVDMGTNSTRLLVADVRGNELEEAERLLEITRLGDRVDTDGRLADAADGPGARRARPLCGTSRELGTERVLATATSAVRDAANGREFLAEVGRRHGFETRLLSGREEAELTYRGVTSRLSAGHGTLVCDIGGGSTELVLGGPDGVVDATSLDIGCVRMSERCLHGDPPSAAELAALRAAVAGILPEASRRRRTLVGVAGTVTTLAAIDLDLEREVPELVDGHPLAQVDGGGAPRAAGGVSAGRAALGPRADAGAGADDRGGRGDRRGGDAGDGRRRDGRLGARHPPRRRSGGRGPALSADNAAGPGGGAGRHGGLKIPFPSRGARVRVSPRALLSAPTRTDSTRLEPACRAGFGDLGRDRSASGQRSTMDDIWTNRSALDYDEGPKSACSPTPAFRLGRELAWHTSPILDDAEPVVAGVASVCGNDCNALFECAAVPPTTNGVRLCSQDS